MDTMTKKRGESGFECAEGECPIIKFDFQLNEDDTKIQKIEAKIITLRNEIPIINEQEIEVSEGIPQELNEFINKVKEKTTKILGKAKAFSRS